MKTDFNQIPDWVCWLAQDADGSWWGYEDEPNMSHNGWYENETGQYVFLGRDAANQCWRSTLKAIGRNEEL